MTDFTNYKLMTLDSIHTMWTEIGRVLPNILGAILVIVLGWFFTIILLFIVSKALKLTRVHLLNEKINAIDIFGNKDFNIRIDKLILTFIRWTMIIILLIVVSDILNLKIISEEITKLLNYLPRLVSAFVIFTFGLLFANFVKKSIASFFTTLDISGSKIISQFVFILILIFVLITSLNQAGVDTQIITTNLTMILGAFLLTFALALGLGAKSVAADLLRTFYVRKIYEIGQNIEYDGIRAEIESIDNITMVIKTNSGRIVIPIKKVISNEVKIITTESAE